MAVKEGKVVVISSAKGGVGKSTLALDLANHSSKKTIVVDFDLSGRALATSLNLEFELDIYELLGDLESRKYASLENYVVDYKKKFAILVAPNDPRKISQINYSFVEVLLHELKTKYELIIIDTNHVIDKLNLILHDLADEIIFVVTPNLIDFKNIKSVINIYKNIDKTNYKIVLNRALNKSNYYSDSEARALIEENIDYIIPTAAHLKNYEKQLLNGEIKSHKKHFSKILKAIGGE